MAGHERRKKRREDVKRRASRGTGYYRRCMVLGCKNAPSALSGKGLNRRYCRAHEDQYERHGSYFKKSYTAAQVTPFRTASLRWLKANQADPMVHRAVEAIMALYRQAGPHIEAFRLRGLPPEERARAAWARLREAEVDPLQPLAAWLAVELALLVDPQSESKPEFKQVQAAKLVHRMASGSHRRWEQVRAGGRIVVKEMHTYPASRGRVLRHIGEQLERAVELVAAYRLDEIRVAMTAPVPITA